MAYEAYCAACTYMSENSDYTGKYWCENKGEDRYASDAKCYSFCEAYGRSNYSRENMYNNSLNHSGSSGCYLTTIMCKLLNYPDDNYYLNTLRMFRDNTMKPNPKYIPLLLMYDFIGPIISYELEKDIDGKNIANIFFTKYITKAVSAIEEEKYDMAINIYKAMTDELASRYNINISLITPETTNNIDMANLGHAKVRKLIIPKKES